MAEQVNIAYLKGWSETVLESAMRNILVTEIVNGKRRSINTTRRLYNSLRSDVVEVYNTFIVEFYSTESYAKWVHDGRPPGKKPPIDPILKWMAKKPLRIRDKKTGMFVTMTDKRKRSTAFAIATNIGKYGTRATKFMERAVYEQLDELPDAIREVMQQKVEITIDKFFNR